MKNWQLVVAALALVIAAGAGYLAGQKSADRFEIVRSGAYGSNLTKLDRQTGRSWYLNRNTGQWIASTTAPTFDPFASGLATPFDPNAYLAGSLPQGWRYADATPAAGKEANPFDAFDAPPAAGKKANAFDPFASGLATPEK
jgi:hypothetical protein